MTMSFVSLTQSSMYGRDESTFAFSASLRTIAGMMSGKFLVCRVCYLRNGVGTAGNGTEFEASVENCPRQAVRLAAQ